MPAHMDAAAAVIAAPVAVADADVTDADVADTHWADTDVAHADYVGMFGTGEIQATVAGGVGNGVLYRNSAVRIAEVRDGMSNTIFVGERSSDLALATWSHRSTGVLSTDTCPPGSKAPKKKLCHDRLMLRTAAS